MSSRDQKGLRSVRVSDKEIEVLLDRLDNSPDGRNSDRREYTRFPFRVNCPIHLEPARGGARTSYIAPTRNLSAFGMAFLHGMFVHDGTQCFVQVTSHYGGCAEFTGRVVGCRYIESGVHEVSIRFDDKIEPADYCRAAISYRVLVAEDDDSLARLSIHHLTALNATVDRVGNGEEAVEQARSTMYDLILMDIEMPIMDGLEATRSLRAAGYAGPIYAMTALTRPEDADKCIEAGCDRYISKPGSPDVYASILDSLAQEPLISSFQSDPALRPLIAKFVEELPGMIRSMQDAIGADRLGDLQDVTRTLKGQAGGFGFEPISQAASKLELAVQEDAEKARVAKLTTELAELCLLARAPSITGGSEAA